MNDDNVTSVDFGGATAPQKPEKQKIRQLNVSLSLEEDGAELPEILDTLRKIGPVKSLSYSEYTGYSEYSDFF